MMREVEARFCVDDAFDVPGLVGLGLPGVDGVALTPGEPRRQVLRVTCFDTPSLDLARHRLTLRQRLGGRGSGWHLTSCRDGAECVEVRLPPGRSLATTVPDTLGRLVRARTLEEPLVPVATISTRRTIHRLHDPTGRVVVELADDRVTARRVLPVGDPGEAGGPELRWRELVVEAVDGDVASAASVAEALRTHGLEVAPRSSTCARVLDLDGLPARGRRGRHTATTSTSHVSLAYIGEHVERLRSLDLQVRLDAPGSVHAMRVTTRRLRSALDTVRTAFASEVAQPLRSELRWLGGLLGAVRDAEVMRERVLGALRTEPEHLAASSGARAAHEELRASYDAVREAMLVELDGERYVHLLLALARFVADPPTTKKGRRPAGKTLRPEVAREYADVRRLVKRAQRAPAGAEREVLLHDARKAAKRARYSAELAGAVYGRRARAFAAAMESTQELLGHHQDSVVLRRRLLELARTTTDPIAAFTYGRLHALEDARARETEERLPAVWAKVSRKRLRRWLR